jgi:methionine salvage enolase-phosphatase E1
MKNLNETQKDILGTLIALSLVFTVVGYFTVTQPNYVKTNEEPVIEAKHVQSPVLEKYGKLFTKN